jgi:hypothetical protein
MSTEFQVTMALTADEMHVLKSAMLAYSKGKDVNLENFDLVRDLYGKLNEAWQRRKNNISEEVKP